NPGAWRLTAARRRLVDGARHAGVAAAAEADLKIMLDERADASPAAFPDERLALLFVCAHPAIDEAARTPLMLQTVLGLDAARIASAFLVAPATMSQRLVRVKAKIREAGIRFEMPVPGELAARLDAVLEAIYAAYGSGWEDVAGADPRRRALAGEAIAWLYEGLLRWAPTLGARVAYAAALAEARSANVGLAALETIPSDAVVAYQPYWALRGHLLSALGQGAQAREAYGRAVGLSE